jgi:hypothetical protein
MQACCLRVVLAWFHWLDLAGFGTFVLVVENLPRRTMCHTLNVHTLLLQSLYWHTLWGNLKFFGFPFRPLLTLLLSSFVGTTTLPSIPNQYILLLILSTA